MNCFEKLGLTSSATVEEVKKAWRQLASFHHPDHGGDGAKFNEIRQAYKEALKRVSVNKPQTPKCGFCNDTGRVQKRTGFYKGLMFMCICKLKQEK